MNMLTQKQPTGITLKTLLLGIALIPINCYWLVQMEIIRYSAHSTLYSLFFNVVFSVFVLFSLNLLLRKLALRIALNQRELLTIYVMLSLSSAISGHSMMQVFVPILGHAFWGATAENEWQELFWQYIPRWLAVDNKKVLKEYYEGDSTLYTIEHIRAWLTPVVIWTAFIGALVFVMLCINVILRKQWIEKEKLAYPVIQLPLEMTSASTPFFRNKLMWIGFALAGGYDLINGLHFFFPLVPNLRIKPFDLGNLFTTKPWNAIGNMPISLRPFVVGLVFLIPLDLSFSCWFFFLFWKVQLVFGSAMGWRSRPEFPEQSAGAYIALCLLALWGSRRYLLHRFKDDSRSTEKKAFVTSTLAEPMSYRKAVFGLIGGLLFILLFCYKAGMSIWVVIVFFLLYLLTVTAITRMRAELGSPVHDLHFAGPEILMTGALGTRRLGKNNLTIISFFWFLTRAHYSDVMPHQLEGFKLAERAKMDNRRLFWGMIIAIVVGVLASFWALLHSFYREGVRWGFGHESLTRLQNWLSYPKAPDYPGMVSFAGGLLFSIFLMIMRTRFVWWPFHPAGYAVSSTYQMRENGFCFFVSWLAKWAILKYGGLKTHRKAIPLFLGLILGEYVLGSLWTIIGIAFNIQTYNFTRWW
ncbi:hypothetical protein FJZ31_25390 [Candidatus Poribacteria bacterium]|nr:hypothetical protein [Candidatus Poribacteria bacterium]